MSNEKKSVKRQPRVLAARDLMSVTGGAGANPGSDIAVPQPRRPWDPQRPGLPGPRNPWGPGGPTVGMFPQGPRNPLGEK